MINIVIFGSGSHAKVIFSEIVKLKKWDLLDLLMIKRKKVS